jgi:hypothetical protein
LRAIPAPGSAVTCTRSSTGYYSCFFSPFADGLLCLAPLSRKNETNACPGVLRLRQASLKGSVESKLLGGYPGEGRVLHLYVEQFYQRDWDGVRCRRSTARGGRFLGPGKRIALLRQLRALDGAVATKSRGAPSCDSALTDLDGPNIRYQDLCARAGIEPLVFDSDKLYLECSL